MIACVPAVTEFSRDVKAAAGQDTQELQATRRMPLWTLAIALTTGKNIRLFEGSHCQDERLAWVASRGQWTSYSNSFRLESLGSELQQSKSV